MGTSRPTTAPTSRAGSVAREILKRLDKPYKSEMTRVLEKKKRLQIHTSYSAPPGFTFLPLGTPELAERCQELSRQRGLPIHVVNAKPHSRHNADPTSVSHHTSRIGYHFNAGILDETCQQLGYVLYHGQFVKEVDLQAQYTQSRIAQTMAKHGLKADQPKTQETPAQVRAAIKELFPKIPELDLDKIVTHAWAEGSDRVGTVAELPLSRRVQLATIARIRHQYTDYDSLLKAFGDWKSARETVEPDCLRKLIEWRGEIEVGDDEELHEIVRETIVIPDDDDDHYHGASRNAFEDSAADPGNTSDASIEVTHQLARDEDLGAESADDRYRYGGLRHRHWNAQQMEDWNSIARQKIGDMRRQIRDAPPSNTLSVSVRPNERGELPSAIVVNGQLFQRGPPDPRPLATDAVLRSPFPERQHNAVPAHDWPVLSIERQGISRQPSPLFSVGLASHNQYNGHVPLQPGSSVGHLDKRRRLDYRSDDNMGSVSAHDHDYARGITTYDDGIKYSQPIPEQATILTSSERPQWTIARVAQLDGSDASDLVSYNGRVYKENRAPTCAPPGPLSVHYGAAGRPTAADLYSQRSAPEQYDPRAPLMPTDVHGLNSQMSHRQQATLYPQTGHSHAPAPLQLYEVPQHNGPTRANDPRPLYPDEIQQRVIYVQPEAHLPPPPPPVHGAPAPIQPAGQEQFPRAIAPARMYYEDLPAPVNGAPHPAQFYTSR